MQRKRKPPARDRGVNVEAEQLLNPNMQRWCVRAVVVYHVISTSWRSEMRGRLLVEATPEVPWNESIERCRQILRRDLIKPCLS